MDWQLILVAAMVVVAATYLVRRAYKSYRAPGCGDGCSSCQSKDRDAGEKLVQIRLKKNDRL